MSKIKMFMFNYSLHVNVISENILLIKGISIAVIQQTFSEWLLIAKNGWKYSGYHTEKK